MLKVETIPEEKKPPLGIMPYEIWKIKVKQTRLLELTDAIVRYTDAGKVIPVEWSIELSGLISDIYQQNVFQVGDENEKHI